MGKLSTIALILLALNCNPQMKTFNWIPTECAPKDYPVQLVQAHFKGPDGESFKMATGKTVSKGWGKMGTIYMSGDEYKPAPVGAHLIWYSFVEDLFYKIDMSWEASMAEELLSTPYISPVDNGMKNFETIMLAIGPGGIVNVWLYGEQVVLEMASGEGETYDMPWEDFMPSTSVSRKEYQLIKLSEVMDEERARQLIDTAVPRERYAVDMRKRYPYDYQILGEQRAISAHTRFISGEREYVHFQKNKGALISERAVPESCILEWAEGPTEYVANIQFDESETARALDILAENGGKSIQLQFELRAAEPRLSIALSDDESFVQLEAAKLLVRKKN